MRVDRKELTCSSAVKSNPFHYGDSCAKSAIDYSFANFLAQNLQLLLAGALISCDAIPLGTAIFDFKSNSHAPVKAGIRLGGWSAHWNSLSSASVGAVVLTSAIPQKKATSYSASPGRDWKAKLRGVASSRPSMAE